MRNTHRAHIDINSDLRREAMRVSGLDTKRAAAELGLQTLPSLDRRWELRDLRGKLVWKGDLRAMRKDR